LRRLAVCFAVVSASLFLWSTAALGASYHVYVCGPWSPSTGPFVPAAAPHTSYFAFGCGGGADADMNLQGTAGVPNGQGASWTATAPAGLSITNIYTVGDSGGNVGDGHGWWGEFFWNGGPGLAGRSAPITNSFQTNGCCQASFNDRTVGWFISCGVASCTESADLNVGGVALAVDEEQGPWLVAPSGLWQASGWVRGQWSVPFYGDSPSGVCSLAASINGQPLALGAGSAVGRNSSTWHQCSGASADPAVQTGDYGAGAMPLTIGGCDAAGACTGNAYTKTIYVDNTQPTVSLSGPTDAPSTAGAQYVTATASAGPSGVDGISCSVDNAPAQWYPSSTAQVPVSGVGEHSVSCAAANKAVDPAGNHRWSNWGAWSLKIGDPTVSGITFGHVIDALRCRRVKERVKVPAHWVTVRRHHKRVKVRRRAHFRIKKVTKCHPRTKIERVAVRVRVRRHGKMVWITRHKRERVVLLPHAENSTKLRVRHGRTAVVSGWLGTYNGVALAGEPVTILTAPNNGRGQFAPAAAVATAANGTWTAALPAGPSRLVESVYNGGATTEASASAQIVLTVPAKVKLLSVSPRRVAWGGTVRLVGQLYGGYLPAGGALVRLRIGQGSAQTTYGVREHVGGNGRFSTTYTFGQGLASVHRSYWFQLASLPTGDYPYAPARSRRLTVRVGGHPHPPPRHHRHKKHGKWRKRG
jgi:hypothetical protein